jgi:hypothetical protein
MRDMSAFEADMRLLTLVHAYLVARLSIPPWLSGLHIDYNDSSWNHIKGRGCRHLRVCLLQLCGTMRDLVSTDVDTHAVFTSKKVPDRHVWALCSDRI